MPPEWRDPVQEHALAAGFLLTLTMKLSLSTLASAWKLEPTLQLDLALAYSREARCRLRYGTSRIAGGSDQPVRR
jgi:hypothetical protein